MRDLTIGDTVYGQTKQDTYQIVDYIDRGSFGSVYKILDQNKQRFALKTIHTPSLNATGFRALVNEGHLATSINHPNVVRTLFFHDGEQYDRLPPYVILEYADSGTLMDLLVRKRAIEDQFDSQELRDIFLQLAFGMKAINEKLVHRDIHPGNILMAENLLKIADFGLSKIVGAATRSQTFKGTQHLRYRAPEAWRMEENNRSMDMYSMGITFYEVATLRNPYETEVENDTLDAWEEAHFFKMPTEPSTLNPLVDLALDQLMMKMIRKRPEERYASWDEVIARLQSEPRPKESSRDVTALVQQAINSQRQHEHARLKEEELRDKMRERDKLMMFAFGEIRKAVNETVENFNQQSEVIQLHIHDVGIELGPGFVIYATGPGGISGEIKVAVVGVFDEHKLQGQLILAWGYVKASSSRGFNLVLVSGKPDNLYPKWITLQATHNPTLVNHKIDRRPIPFAFHLHELPDQIQYLNTSTEDRFETKQGEFQAEMLNPLLQELLSYNDPGTGVS